MPVLVLDRHDVHAIAKRPGNGGVFRLVVATNPVMNLGRIGLVIRGGSVKGNDLTLTGDTPSGPLTIVLQQRNKKITGVWKIEDQSGTLSGTMRAK